MKIFVVVEIKGYDERDKIVGYFANKEIALKAIEKMGKIKIFSEDTKGHFKPNKKWIYHCYYNVCKEKMSWMAYYRKNKLYNGYVMHLDNNKCYVIDEIEVNEN